MHITSVTTKTYAIDKHSFFKLLVTWRYKKRWWIDLLSLAAAFGFIWYMTDYKEVFWYVVPTVVVLAVATSLIGPWRLVNAKGIQKYYFKRHYVMDYDKLSSFVEDGSSTVTMINSFIKAETMGSYYLLYLSKFHYIFIPIDAFKTSEDRQWFETHVIGKIKTPGFM